jgi:hypothetical protein
MQGCGLEESRQGGGGNGGNSQDKPQDNEGHRGGKDHRGDDPVSASASAAVSSTVVRAVVLIYPALVDADDVPTVPPKPAAPGGDTPTTSFSNASLSNKPVNSTRIPLAAYVVASTNDRMLPPHLHGDVVVEQLREVWGLECTYQRAKLGDHGFGVISKWTRPCAAWLRGVLLAADNP